MSYIHPDALEGLRRRWLRHDAHRFAAPGTPEADPGFLHPWAEVARQEQAAADEAKARALAEQDEFEREVLRLRHDFAKLKLEYELRRFQQKYSPDQPRVPAGSGRESGRWTDSGGSGTGRDSGDAQSTDFSAQARRAGPPRGAPLTPQQQARLDLATARAQEATYRVQQIDPNWQPTQSVTNPNNNESFVRAKEEMVREAEARFMALSRAGEVQGFPPQNSQTNAEVIRPGGQFIGSGNSSVRTVSPEQFEAVRLTLMNGARQIESRDDYTGVLYQRRDGSIFGLRLSRDNGLTLDILRSTDPAIRDSFRIHQR